MLRFAQTPKKSRDGHSLSGKLGCSIILLKKNVRGSHFHKEGVVGGGRQLHREEKEGLHYGCWREVTERGEREETEKSTKKETNVKPKRKMLNLWKGRRTRQAQLASERFQTEQTRETKGGGEEKRAGSLEKENGRSEIALQFLKQSERKN